MHLGNTRNDCWITHLTNWGRIGCFFYLISGIISGAGCAGRFFYARVISVKNGRSGRGWGGFYFAWIISAAKDKIFGFRIREVIPD